MYICVLHAIPFGRRKIINNFINNTNTNTNNTNNTNINNI